MMKIKLKSKNFEKLQRFSAFSTKSENIRANFIKTSTAGARPARAFPLVANKQHQAVISEISEIGWLRRLAVTARLAVLAG